jgi:transcriptional regulator with GAF, ATPase, and Fis domain/tetratricopeptide (TPR) repeat protein
LGEGASGRVWLVEDGLRPGVRLALKELSAADTEDGARHEESLRREFATLACLRHPNLVEVHEFDRSPESGLPRFTLEFIEGRDLVEAVAHEGSGLWFELAVEALRALAFLHDFDLIHGDLKPANLLVRDRPKLGCRLVVVDFGFARTSDEETVEAYRARGTLPYMAPEVLKSEGAGPRSDLYALAAVLYEAVSGHPPYRLEGSDLSRFIQSVIEGRRARPALPDDYPEGLASWFEEVLSPDPEARPATAGEALARFNEACGTDHPAETPASRAARLLSGPPGEREEAIARIRESLEPSLAPRVVWLCGDAGSGKTRILRWLEADGIRDGWHVVSAGPHDPLSLDGLRAMARERPTMVLLDEVDAAGAGTVEIVDRVAREPDQPPVQIVAALRPGQIEQPTLRKLYADTGTVPTLRPVTLERLGEDGIRAMAARAARGEVSDERVQWLLQASEGSPAVAETLLIEGAWERGGESRPLRKHALLPEGRLEMLSSSARAWLDALAVLRGDAREDHIAELASMTAGAARSAAGEASAAGLTHRSGGHWITDSRTLVAHLLSTMEPDRREALHGKAAEMLESSTDPRIDPWLLSRLWSRAGKRQLAIAYAIRAAERSQAENDPAEAAARYGQALRLMGRGEQRLAIRLKQAEALTGAGMHQRAARACGAAVRLSRTEGDRIEALTRQASALVQCGRFERGLSVAERATRLASASGDDLQQARAGKAAAIALGRMGREQEAIPLLESAREIVRRRDERDAEAEIVQILATCKLRLGREGAEEDFVEALKLYREADRPHPADEREAPAPPQEIKALIGLAVIKVRSGEHDRAVELLERAREAAVRQGNLGLQEAALSKLAVVAIDRDQLDRAIALAGQAADLARHLGDENLILVNRCRLADARIRCGRAGEAMVLLRETVDRPLARVEPENVDYARMLLAEAWMETGSGDEDTIRALLEETLARCRTRPKRRPLLAALVIEMERRARPGCDEAFEPISLEFGAAVESSGEEVDAELRIRAGLARAAFHLEHGHPDAALAAAEDAAAAAREASASAFEVRAKSLLAEAHRRLGREEQAREARQEGRRLLDEAAARIHDGAIRADFLARPGFASLREEGTLAAGKEHGRLLALYDMIRALNSETDPDALLESILDMALRAVKAERGMILLKDEPGGPGPRDLSIHLARNLEQETIRDAESYSRKIVEAAGAGQSLLVVDSDDDERVRKLESISLYGIRSLMCVPLRSRGKIVGTVYLDSRRSGVLFTHDDLRFLEAFANHAALALENTRTRVRLERHNRQLQAAAESRTSLGNLVGRCPAMQAVFDLIDKVAGTELPVLIHGESGTGKELVASAIHYRGPRRRRMFVSVNCAAIPESLLESELFGHVRGAFTGAERDRRGLFEQAHGGTLFLDEIGDMSAAMQARLLRVLEEGRVRRVGGEQLVEVDVRVLTATHRDLPAEVKAGRFREDLLYRLRVLTIELPPLRERTGDVALLVDHFLKRIAEQRGRPPHVVADDALSLFEAYGWPGNVRELENVLTRLVLLAGEGPVTAAVIEADPGLRRALTHDAASGKPAFSLKDGEKEQIRRAIEAAGGNRSRAAGLLGVSRATLYRKIRQHGI